MKDFRDYYQVLGVTRFATADEIRTAYRRAARRYHPDVNLAPDASARMSEVNEAHDVLSDPRKRSGYDAFGARHGVTNSHQPASSASQGSQSNGSHGSDSRSNPSHSNPSQSNPSQSNPSQSNPSQSNPSHSHASHSHASDSSSNRPGSRPAGAAPGSDFLSSIFGRRADRPARPGVQGFAPGDSPFKGCDQEASVEISVAEAYHGTTRTVTLRTPPQAATLAVGARTSSRSIEVCIPQGVCDRQRVRLAGQGAPSLSGGRPGDLYLEVTFAQDANIRTEGRDVSQKLPVAPWEAALGATIEAETVAGHLELRIPPGSHSGRRLRLRGKGLPGAEPGDLFLEIELVLPPAKSEASRSLYAQMAREMRFDPRAEMKTRHAAGVASG